MSDSTINGLPNATPAETGVKDVKLVQKWAQAKRYKVYGIDDEGMEHSFEDECANGGWVRASDCDAIAAALVAALTSIAANTCCGTCQEAAKVASEALAKVRL